MPAFREQIQAFIDANLSPAARSATLATMAKGMRADIVSAGRAPDASTTYVDGVAGADESQVRGTGGGTIMYRFNYMIGASAWALAFLQTWAPSRTGQFRGSFFVAINGRFVPAAAFNPQSVPYDAEVIIGNTQPYSRKVDVQLDGSRVLHYSVPSGMYDACATAVQRQFNRAVLAKRLSTISFPGQYVLRHGGNKGQIVNSPVVVLTPVL